MQWEKDAEQAMSRVPFFVRKRVKKKVEAMAGDSGATMVTMVHVEACRQRFMTNQEKEVKGFQVETCFGAGGCPNAIANHGDMADRLEKTLAALNLKEFMRAKVDGPLKMHHEFRVSISDCPNSCSRPQIVDIGLIGAAMPTITAADCSRCEACITACREHGITLAAQGPAINFDMCLACGQCYQNCPTETLRPHKKGFRILLGGKLGRHPQLGRELNTIFSPDETMTIVEKCLAHFMAHNEKGERFGELLNRTGYDFLKPLAILKKLGCP
ncbi:MAG: 4Fe-4S binding protein [Desulfobulbaceae bacterium]|nr:4Fe-4S binding protein [Desulfobulbaceae bacterium]HIJ80001.1 4Fe-4S binding protein [Deltaproteobacteria bacterium]